MPFGKPVSLPVSPFGQTPTTMLINLFIIFELNQQFTHVPPIRPRSSYIYGSIAHLDRFSILPYLYTDSMAPLLQLHHLAVRFGSTQAVGGVSLHRNEGEVLGLVGASGSCKSATALAILGLLGPTAQVTGQILWRDSGTNPPADPIDLLRLRAAALRQLSELP